MIGGHRALQTSMLNDTGSNTLDLFAHEAQFLGYNPHFHATRPVRVHTSNGYVDRTAILLEFRVLRYDGQALTGWFVEDAAIVPFTGTEVRLSRDGVRRELFFCNIPS